MKSVKELTTDHKRMWILPVVLVLAYALIQAAAFAILPARDEEGAIVRGGRVEITDLETGDCFDWVTDVGTGSIRQIDLKPCDGDHEAVALTEIYYPAPTTEPWPGVETINTYAIAECMTTAAGLEIINIMPTAESWTEGDRAVMCIGI